MAKKNSRKREWVFRIIAIVLAIGFTLLAIDRLVFSPGDMESVETISINDEINMRNQEFAKGNPHGFTDEPHSLEKPDSVFRIACLGDSFIWGDGLPYEDVWTHKLEQLIEADYKNIEVMHWGINGWQTTDQIAFYDTVGYKYNPDLLILGYVDNDPDMGHFRHMDPHFRETYKWFYRLFPGLTTLVLDRFYAKSYAQWLEDLHGQKNLTEYAKLLKQVKARFDKDSLTYFAVMTPACLEPCHPYYDSVKPVMDTVGFTYIDVFYPIMEELGHLPLDSIRANPSNYHPGTKMTKIFAEETYKYLQQNNYLPDSLRRNAGL